VPKLCATSLGDGRIEMTQSLTPDEMRKLNEERRASMLRKFSVPIMYAPLLPLIRVSLRHNPPLRDKVFAGSILVALFHAGVVMSSDSSVL